MSPKGFWLNFDTVPFCFGRTIYRPIWIHPVLPRADVSILMKPAQLMKTLGPMWQEVTSCCLFSSLGTAMPRSVLRRLAPLRGPSPPTNCTRFWEWGCATHSLMSTPTSFTRLMKLRFNACGQRGGCQKVGLTIKPAGLKLLEIIIFIFFARGSLCSAQKYIKVI
jgi:hypothetical protein